MIKLFKSDIMEFYCLPDDFGVIPEPVPAYKMMPEWFKKIPQFMENKDQFGAKGLTAKKCMPLLDSMSLGYIIPLWGDVNIRTSKDGKLIDASKNPYGPLVEFHGLEQLGNKTSPTYPRSAIKFINRWVIKTAPGYSTLFIPPINRIEPRFTCLSGLVETDSYPKEINFPAIWHLNDFDGLVEAGTPLVTVIPIKRSDTEKIAKPRKMTDKEKEKIIKIQNSQNGRRHVYTNELRGSIK